MDRIQNMQFLDQTLERIQESITSGEFRDVESAKIELKDLSSGTEWKSLKESVCAFLNTDGGIVIGGVREREKKYRLTGFDRNNESKILELTQNTFKDDKQQTPDLSQYIHQDYRSLRDKEGKERDVLILLIYPLSFDEKCLSYNGVCYKRLLTADIKISQSELRAHKEYKDELIYAKEIAVVQDASLSDLDIDKINRYINLLNREVRIETFKADLEASKQFLSNQHFLKKGEVTTLGLLVSGSDPFHFLASRAEVNCYYDTGSDIGKDKKLFRNDVITLMEDTFRYIWGHIKVARSVSDGGKSIPEYPENLVREMINNALAHRDYSVNDFITVTVEPNQYLEIKNPGSFKEKIKVISRKHSIWRILPGMPDSKNPKLASVLKVFDKIESKGRGMALLVDECLSNHIDLPYYEIKGDSISLRVPSGRLVDEEIENWLTGFQSYIEKKLLTPITQDHKTVLAYFYKSEKQNEYKRYTILLSESNNHLEVINELKSSQLLIEHEVSSDDTPVYVLDRTLMKVDFREELYELLGEEYIGYDPSSKAILNLVYLHTKFNKRPVKASEITPEVYRRIYGRQIDPRKYETLGRKVRKYCNQFAKRQVFVKDSHGGYSVNFDFKPPASLFQ